MPAGAAADALCWQWGAGQDAPELSYSAPLEDAGSLTLEGVVETALLDSPVLLSVGLYALDTAGSALASEHAFPRTGARAPQAFRLDMPAVPQSAKTILVLLRVSDPEHEPGEICLRSLDLTDGASRSLLAAPDEWGAGRGELAPAAPVRLAQPHAAYEDFVEAYQEGAATPPVMPPPGVNVRYGVQYAASGAATLELDLFEPALEGMVPRPALAFLHGGGWRAGDRSRMHPYCAHFAVRGYFAASVSYRLAPGAQGAAPVADVRSAVEWIRANAARMNVDPDQIVLVGRSAGGHLALMAAYGGFDEAPAPVAAVVSISGPSDLTQLRGAAAENATRYAGSDAPHVLHQASPAAYASGSVPPTLLLHGEADGVTPLEQARLLEQRLKAVGAPVQLETLPGWRHGMDFMQPAFDWCCKRIARFLEQRGLAPPEGSAAAGSY